MATIYHSNISDLNAHEPKNISTASVGQVYMADGAGSGLWDDIPTASDVIVKELADLPTPVSSVITLAADKVYLIEGDVDIADNRIEFSSNSVIIGKDTLTSTLTYTGTDALFTMTDVNTALKNFSVVCNSGTVFDWTCTSQKAMRAVDMVVSCNSLGTLTGVDGILRFTNFSPTTISTTGFSFSGSWTSFLYEVSLSYLTAGILFDLTTATFDSFIVKGVYGVVPSGATFLSGTSFSGNIQTGGLGQLEGNKLSGAGTTLSGVTVEDALWEFWHNDSIQDTRPDSLLSLQGNTTATTISTAGTPVRVSGTWVDERGSQFTRTSAGRATYNGGKVFVTPLTARLSLEPSAGTNVNISVYIAINGSAVTNSKASAQIDAGDPRSVTCVWQAELSTDDYVEVFVSNDDSTTSVLASNGVLRVN